jgi:RND family efflux transporter MFP subunit
MEASGFLGVVSATQTADLAPDSDGRVREVFARAGMSLRAGDPIVQIDLAEVHTSVGVAGAELQQRASDVARAEARLEAAEAKAERLQAGGNWLSEQELENARSEVRVARAERDAARSATAMGKARLRREQLREERHTIVAPFSGVLVNIDVDPGDSVLAGRPIARLLSTEREVRFAVPRPALSEMEASGVALAIPGHEGRLPTHLRSLRPEIDTSAQLVFASAALPDAPVSADLLPGTVVRVHALGDKPGTEVPVLVPSRGQP